MKRTTTFTKGSGVYECNICGRKTRDDGHRDSVHLRLCSQCFELGGIENMFHDGCGEAGDAREALALIKELEGKGAHVSEWEKLREVATKALHQEGNN